MKRLTLLILATGCGKVIEEPPPPGAVTIAVTQQKAFVRQGEQVDLDVAITAENVTGAVAITAANLPSGVSLQTLDLDPGTTTGTLHLTADATATQGVAAPTFVATSVDDPSATAESTPIRLLVGGTPGSLDTSFATDGTFTPTLGGLAMSSRGQVMTSKGLVVTGFVVTNPFQALTARILEDGTLDPAFGSGGFVSTGFGPAAEGIGIAEAANGDIVVAGVAGGSGSADDDFGVFRYDSNGSLVTTFGASGVVSIDGGNQVFAEFRNIVLEPDGSAIVGGTVFGASNTTRALRFSPTGVQDPNFNVSETNVVVNGSALQADGKLVLTGSIGNTDSWVARFNTNGTRDAGFGTNGVVTTDFGGLTDEAHGVILLPGNKLLVFGIANPRTSSAILTLARYNANGSPDATFGNSGKIQTTTSFDSFSQAAPVVVNDQFYFAGRRPSDKRPGVVRVNADGTLDTNFGTGGTVFVDFGVAATTNATGAFGLSADPDGRILISCDIGGAGQQQMGVARLWF